MRCFGVAKTCNFMLRLKTANKLSVVKKDIFSRSIPLFSSLKHYSICTLSNLDFLLGRDGFAKLSEEEICKILLTEKNNGGPGLTYEDIKPLILGGFNGITLGSMVNNLKKNKDAIEEPCKTYPCVNRIVIKTLVDWLEDLVNAPDLSPPKYGNLPYQPDEQTISSMANTLLGNIYKHKTEHPIRDQELLVCSGYVGTGKTRLGVEFLSCWKKQIIQNPKLRTELETKFRLESVEQLANSKTVYVDCRKYNIINNSLEETFKKLKKDIKVNINGYLSEIPCFIIIDEIDCWFQEYKPTPRAGFNRKIASTFEIFHKLINQLQKIPTVNLYVCGKGPFLDVGQGYLSLIQLQAPSKTLSVQLIALTQENIRTVLADSNNEVGKIVSKYNELGLFNYFANELYQETRGMQNFVVEYVYNKHNRWLNCSTMEEISNTMVDIRGRLDSELFGPLKKISRDPSTAYVWQILLIVYELKLNINPKWLNSTKIEELCEFLKILIENLSNSEYNELLNQYSKKLKNKQQILKRSSFRKCTLGTILNGFFQHADNGRFKLQFPKAVIENSQKLETQKPSLLYFLSDFGESGKYSVYGPMISKGALLERMSLESLIIRMHWGFMQGFSIGEVIPFLKNTDVESIPCFPLQVIDLQFALKQNGAGNTQQWKKVLEKLKKNTVGTFKEGPHYPDKIWLISHGGEQFFVQFQEKNVETFDRITLQQEIEKNEKIRKVKGYEDAKIIMVFLIRSKNPFAGKVYGYGKEIDGIASNIKGKNTQVIIPSEKDINEFFGECNIQALDCMPNKTE